MSDDACANYGFLNGSSCACPVGWGGSDCTLPSCGGTIFQGSSRPTVPQSPGGGFPNLNSAGCTCEDGWDGVGCNVCRTPDACLVAYNAVHGNSSAASSGYQSTSDTMGQNSTITCNMQTMVYAASQMSCDVNVRIMPDYSASLLLMSTVEPDAASTVSSKIYLEHHAGS